MDNTDTATPCDPRSRVTLVLCNSTTGQRLRIHHQSSHDSITPTANLCSSSVILGLEKRTCIISQDWPFSSRLSEGRSERDAVLCCLHAVHRAESSRASQLPHSPEDALMEKNLWLSKQLSSNANVTDMNFTPLSRGKLPFTPKGTNIQPAHEGGGEAQTRPRAATSSGVRQACRCAARAEGRSRRDPLSRLTLPRAPGATVPDGDLRWDSAGGVRVRSHGRLEAAESKWPWPLLPEISIRRTMHQPERRDTGQADAEAAPTHLSSPSKKRLYPFQVKEWSSLFSPNSFPISFFKLNDSIHSEFMLVYEMRV